MSDSLQRKESNGIQNGQDGFQFIPNFAFEKEDTEDNKLSPEIIISILLRYKWFILLFLIAGGVGAWFYADTVTPVYQSKGTIMISSAGGPDNNELSRIISQATGHGTNSTIENELQILHSKRFSVQVAQKIMAEDLGDINEFPILWKQNENGEVFRATEEVVAERVRNGFSASKVEEEADVIQVNFVSSSPQEASTIVNEAMEIYVETSTRQNREAAVSTAEFLEKEKKEIEERLQASEEKLRKYMDNTGIVRVDEQASGLVSRRVETETELQRVNLELETVRQTIASYEKRLEAIKPGLSEQFSEAIGPRIRNLQEELARYENERAQIIAKNPNVLQREQLPPRLKFLDEQSDRVKGKIKELSERLFSENDEFMGIDGADRAEIVSNIQTRLVELRIELNQHQSRRDALLQQKEAMDEKFNALPEGMIDLAKLQRDVRINEELFLNVSRQYSDMSLWKQSQYGFGRILDNGDTPGSPVSPNKKIYLLLGMMLGGLVSVLFITIREFTDSSVKSVDQLRTHLPSLMFSAIPSIERVSEKERKSFVVGKGKIPDEVVMLQDPASIVSESFRRLKNNIIYQQGIAPPKTIAVTSPEKGDGKSTVVTNLGVAFAEEGYKTLLIGADFRRPKLQKYLGLTPNDGLFDYLSGDISFQELLMSIQNTDLKALKVISSGRETQNPELIGNSKTFKQFLNKMEEVFDVILMDTPPFGIISDATALLKYAEATLVVVRHRSTNSSMLLRTIEELGRIQANVKGIVLNDFDHRQEPYSAGYYHKLYGNYEAYVK